MYCPQCHHDTTKVIDSRESEGGIKIRRRRKCEKCEYRFTTVEKIIINDLLVKKSNGHTEVYDKDKLHKSISIACAKRSITKEAISQLIDDLEQSRVQQGNEITSEQIGLDVLIKLKELDPIAYVRFASVYMKFDSIKDFQQILV